MSFSMAPMRDPFERGKRFAFGETDSPTYSLPKQKRKRLNYFSTAERQAIALRVIEGGLSQARVAHDVGCSQNRVYHCVKDFMEGKLDRQNGELKQGTRWKWVNGKMARRDDGATIRRAVNGWTGQRPGLDPITAASAMAAIKKLDG
jgi:transposase-like protein